MHVRSGQIPHNGAADPLRIAAEYVRFIVNGEPVPRGPNFIDEQRARIRFSQSGTERFRVYDDTPFSHPDHRPVVIHPDNVHSAGLFLEIEVVNEFGHRNLLSFAELAEWSELFSDESATAGQYTLRNGNAWLTLTIERNALPGAPGPQQDASEFRHHQADDRYTNYTLAARAERHLGNLQFAIDDFQIAPYWFVSPPSEQTRSESQAAQQRSHFIELMLASRGAVWQLNYDYREHEALRIKHNALVREVCRLQQKLRIAGTTIHQRIATPEAYIIVPH